MFNSVRRAFSVLESILGLCLLAFRSDRYGMMNHIVYDVYIKNTGDGKDEDGLSGTSRFGTDFERFTKKGLQFK